MHWESRCVLVADQHARLLTGNTTEDVEDRRACARTFPLETSVVSVWECMARVVIVIPVLVRSWWSLRLFFVQNFLPSCPLIDQIEPRQRVLKSNQTKKKMHSLLVSFWCCCCLGFVWFGASSLNALSRHFFNLREVDKCFQPSLLECSLRTGPCTYSSPPTAPRSTPHFERPSTNRC